MRSSREKQKADDKTLMLRAVLLSELIMNHEFWNAFGEEKRIPTYITNLQKIVRDFEDKNIGRNPAKAKEFLDACLRISGPEIEQYEKRFKKEKSIPGYVLLNTNEKAKQLYALMGKIQHASCSKYDALIASYNEFVMYSALAKAMKILNYNSDIKNLKKEYNAFKKHTTKHGIPELLLIMDFIYTKIIGKLLPAVQFVSLLPVLQNFADHSLLASTSLFLSMLSDPESLALTLREDSYGIRAYNKKAAKNILPVYELPHATEKQLNILLRDIMSQAMKQDCFDSIFNDVADINKFIAIYSAERTEHTIRAARLNNKLIVGMLENVILKNKKLLFKIATSQDNQSLMASMPVLRDACRKAAYGAAAMGLLSSKIKANEGPIKELPKDVIQKIAKKVAEDTVKDDQQNKPKSK